ncbi:MAG: hypothetical protein HQL27_08620 [Candidatus Omnitrophica bacterium]|nr:hypothetical protein [Candidatus Omnitrophota bacterium]
MLKIKNIIISGVCLLLALFLCKESTAQVQNHVSTKRALEVSLMSLKESATRLREENNKLVIENESLKKKISQKKQALESLRDKKTMLLIETKPETKQGFNKPLTAVEKKEISDNRLLAVADAKNDSVRVQVIAEDNVAALKMEAASLRESLEQLEGTKRSVCSGLDEESYKRQRDTLSRDLNSIQARVKQLDKEATNLRNRYQKPLVKIIELQKNNDLLKGQVAMSTLNLKGLIEESKSLEANIINIQGNNDDKEKRRTEEINGFNQKKEQIEKDIVRVKCVLEEDATNSGKDYLKTEDLKQNVEMMKKENSSLKEELERLNKTLESYRN